jgi:hypothetical protein
VVAVAAQSASLARGPPLKFTVVTVSFNAAATLTDTLESVARQRGVEVEHWLIDGGSTDATTEVVARHGSHLAGVVSERDRGLYDAMNKGAARARGEVLAFLNADDWYAAPDVLLDVSRTFDAGADLVYGNLILIDAAAPFTIRRVWRDRPHATRDFFRLGWQPAHPATFVRRELFEATGGFDLRWRIAADYAWLVGAMQRKDVRLRHLDRTLVNMRLGGTSTAGLSAIHRANLECARALREAGCWPWLTIAMKTLRKLPQLRLEAPASAATGALWRPWAQQVPEAERRTLPTHR